MSIDSEIDLPELTQEIGDNSVMAPADVQISIGEVPESISDNFPLSSWVDAIGEICLLRFSGIGNFLVEHGRKITIQKDELATFEDLRTWLIGSGLATIMHQRRMIPLHVSAVLAPDGVIAFTGDSGAGKSTMAAHLNHIAKWPLISDDVSVVSREPNYFVLESGVNTVKLWSDALESLQRTSAGMKRDMTRYDKFHAIDPNQFLRGTFPIKRLIKLEWAEETTLLELNGRRAFEVALGAVYRPEIASICGNIEVVAAMAMALANTIKVEILTRPKGSLVKQEVTSVIESKIFA